VSDSSPEPAVTPSQPVAGAGREEWSDPDLSRPLPFWESLRLDALAHLAEPPLQCEGAGRSWSIAMVRAAVRSSGFHLTAVHRLAHALYHRGGPLGRGLASVLSWWNRHSYGCLVASTARLHGGLILPHPQGIVIGPGVVLGPRAWVFQNVTIGGAPGKAGAPRVGADARIYSGAVLTGPIRVGDNVMVGANAVVHRDVPDRTLVHAAAAEFRPLPARYRAGRDAPPEPE
jgi:serine O-acetyltransferase